MNHNIEIINSKLWTLKFSLIPFIKEINYRDKASDDMPMYEEPCRITNEGMIILNKDNRLYNIIKPRIIEAMKLKDKKLNKKLESLKQIKNMSPVQLSYAFAFQIEFERREKERQVNV